MNHRLLWIGTTTLLALDLKRRRSTITQSSTVTAGPRFSNESQTTIGDVEKTNAFDNVSQQPIRSIAQPILPPSPELEGGPIEPSQSNEPTQYDPCSTLNQTSSLTSPSQPELEWSGLDGIDCVGSPIPNFRMEGRMCDLHLEDLDPAPYEERRNRADRMMWALNRREYPIAFVHVSVIINVLCLYPSVK
jgi:hypothetical protein